MVNFMRIQRIYIATYKHDLRLTRICVASIRYWHPDIDIYLVKDEGAGQFATSELQRLWKVHILEIGPGSFGWGFSKLEPLFLTESHKFLVLDADTVFTGPVLDALDKIDAEFIVDDETQPAEDVKRLYFDVGALCRIDPTFKPCGKNFNSGQWVGTSGIINREDFASVVEWSNPPRLKHPQIFMPGDQGVLNYVLERCANAGRCRLARTKLMLWAPRDISQLDLDALRRQSPYHQIIHWAGCKLYSKERMPRSDILDFFERQYYSRIPGGLLLRKWRNICDFVAYHTRRLRRRLKV